MRERVRFMIIYFLFWTIYFLGARVVFLSYHIADAKLLTLETVYGVFYNGIRMDLSMAAYLSIFPFLWITFSNFIKKSVFQNTIFTYTFVCVAIITLLVVIDLEVYNTWSFRIDATPLSYLKSPKEAWASVSSSPIFQLILSFIVLMILSSYIIYRIMANRIYDWNSIKNFPFMAYGIVLVAALIIPIRGGFGIAPMNHSSVYFSKNNFANISAINCSWNFFGSIFHSSSNKVNPYTYLPKDVLDDNYKNLYTSGANVQNILKSTVKKPNVLIIMWESYTKKAVDQQHNGIEITPNFNKLKTESVYFSNIYASGDRTDKAIPAVLSAYPAQSTESIIKDPVKSASLPVLTKIFNNQAYNSSFYYGGDTDFANIKSYLFNSNFDKIVSKDDFDENLATSKWGVHDEFIFNRFLDEHSGNPSKPFFSTILTLSSHEPFETSKPKVIPGDNTEDLFMNSLNYTDKMLAEFLEKAKTKPWWNNTIVIIVADHGHVMPKSNDRFKDFEIPMLWTGGAIEKPIVINKIGSQIDIAATLLGQLKIKSKEFTFSKNMLDNSVKPWAFFSYNNGFGYAKPNEFILFDNNAKQTMGNVLVPKTQSLNEAKAFQQMAFQDYLDR